MRDDDRQAAYQITQLIADKLDVDCIRRFDGEGLVHSTDARERPNQVPSLSNDVVRHLPTAKGRWPKGLRQVCALAPLPSLGAKTTRMVTPIYNEPFCRNASCHTP